MRTIRVGIVGAGLIGGKRAEVIENVGGAVLVAVSDIDRKKALEFSKDHHSQIFERWEDLVASKDIDIVIIAVPNKFLLPIALKALENGKHILAEKPFGKNAQEAEKLYHAAEGSGRIVKVGFNHRFHPAIFKAKQLFDEGLIGKILFIRGRYGHGGRLGMEKEWRFNKDISGGGELLDQGVHLIDLCRWFAGEFDEVYGIAETKFWNTDLEDNAFVILRNKNTTASFHVSTTNWKNIFSFEAFGDKGFLAVQGLGKSYGPETLTIGKRKPEFGVPDIETLEFLKDSSWEDEWRNFLGAVSGKEKIIGDANDGLAANKIIEAIYESSKSKKVVNLRP
ncbi:MAG: Gfo/Idh/MocA family oxidoreductase [Candidatus Liptonbacteria bacterium]|nr:Gfo/Idh/MocA family oxidoreductase [Candidatus Liptonbacteria bacterium]